MEAACYAWSLHHMCHTDHILMPSHMDIARFVFPRLPHNRQETPDVIIIIIIISRVPGSHKLKTLELFSLTEDENMANIPQGQL